MRALLVDERERLKAQLNEFHENFYGMGVAAIWCQIEPTLSMEKKREIFLYILRLLFDSNLVKWGCRSEIVQDFSLVLEMMESCWPDDDEFDDDQFLTVLPYDSDGVLKTHAWIEGDLVWVDDCGKYLWSTDAEL
ncbi:hypothetical protein ACFFU8_11445 [Chromobacterium piscinae]|uniref:hypothetical protein n=1 Tax=Chromobacterium piscinae TaxID=686831 RepID=UPI001E30A689|nr:hypothetical protein [Chromobacterium piscinae]MCD5327541.1 hypothetical protein [Chromobacterium piscinae]